MNTETPLDKLTETADKAREARDDLAEQIVISRDVNGFTWRVIASAVGMTEQGVSKIYRRRTQTGRTPA